MIPYGRQSISEADIQAVAEVLRSDFLTTGPTVPKFEAAVARRVGASHGIAANSATSALHLAVASIGLGPGDWLWTSPITFVASSNCALYCGASVDFVDIDPETFNLCPNALEAKLERTAPERRPKIVVPVHMAGQSTEATRIADLARKYDFRVVEDASHSVGGSYHSAPIGCGAHADVSVFSFHPVKIVTTAEGGLAVTNDPELAARMARLRSHGITRDPNHMTEPPHGPWYYQQIELGWNYRMTELQAALGLSQLERLNAFVNRRNALADRYDYLLADLSVDVPGRQADTVSAFHLYIIRVAPDRHLELFNHFHNAGIGVQLHYIPVHLQPYYRKLGFSNGDFPKAEAYYQRAISLPLYPDLTEEQQDQVVDVLKAGLNSR